MMLWKMAWRELITHKKRSIVTMLLSAFSTALFIFSNAINDGAHNQLIRSSVEVYPGYMEVVNKKFEDEPSFDNLIFDVAGVQQRLDGVAGIAARAVRFETYALYATKEQTIGGMFTAIEPSNEAKVSRLKRSLVEGAYLDDGDANALYLGVELAKRLKVGVGDSVSFIATAADYSFAADNLVVKGLFKTKLYEFDNSSGFVARGYFDGVMQSRNIATHIIMTPDDLDAIDAVTAAAGAAVGDSLVAKNYKETLEDLITAMKVDEIFGYITLGILFIVIFFVIAIFAFLSVYARIRQIGVLRAIGTTPSQVVGMLLIEALLGREAFRGVPHLLQLDGRHGPRGVLQAVQHGRRHDDPLGVQPPSDRAGYRAHAAAEPADGGLPHHDDQPFHPDGGDTLCLMP